MKRFISDKVRSASVLNGLKYDLFCTPSSKVIQEKIEIDVVLAR